MVTNLVVGTVAAGVAYEEVALRWRIWPTITEIVKAHRKRRSIFVGVASGVLATAGWAFWHLLIEE